MLYPSGFQFGIPGYRNPVANSNRIIYLTLQRAQERTQFPSVRFRPWLQAFRDYAFDRRHFTGTEIREQIKATEEFGANGWMLWNPRNIYSKNGLKLKNGEEPVMLKQLALKQKDRVIPKPEDSVVSKQENPAALQAENATISNQENPVIPESDNAVALREETKAQNID